jgi:hypothetical protein
VKATLDHLLAATASAGPGTVTVDGLDFEIRALSRKETMRVHEVQERDGLAAAEVLLLHLGMVDPAMTEDEAEQWMSIEGAGGIVSAVSAGIGKISGMVATSGKDATKSAGR